MNSIITPYFAKTSIMGSPDDEALCAAGIPIKIKNLSGLLHHKFMVLDAYGVAPQPSGDVIIAEIFYYGDGSIEPDEFVEIRNDDTAPIQLQDWVLTDEDRHVFTFPLYLLQPGESCREYTNEIYPEWCGRRRILRPLITRAYCARLWLLAIRD